MSKVNYNQEKEMLCDVDSNMKIDNKYDSIYYPGKPYFEFLYRMKSDDDNYDYCAAFMFA